VKLAIIAPPQYHELVRATRCYMHMALAQELLRDPIYRKFYHEEAHLGAFIIVDNGAAESDCPRFNEVVDAANAISADEIILPDVIENCDETIARTTDFLACSQVEACRRAIVPQGRNIDEWLRCYEEIDRRLHGAYATVCIAKHMEHKCGRAPLIRALNGKHHIHYLGFDGAPATEIAAARATDRIRYAGVYGQEVRSIDTAAPIAYAQENKAIFYGGPKISLDWNGRANLLIAASNIGDLRDELND